MKLNKNFAAKIGADLAILNKERPAQQVAEIGYVIGDVAGKTAVLVDDIIDTAGTLKAAAQAVHDAGARRVYAAATHGVFSGNAWENLAAAGFEQVVVTDTLPLPPGAPGQRPRALLRRPADQLDPPDLHRRLGQRRVRRREPAVLASARPSRGKSLLTRMCRRSYGRGVNGLSTSADATTSAASSSERGNRCAYVPSSGFRVVVEPRCHHMERHRRIGRERDRGRGVPQDVKRGRR